MLRLVVMCRPRIVVTANVISATTRTNPRILLLLDTFRRCGFGSNSHTSGDSGGNVDNNNDDVFRFDRPDGPDDYDVTPGRVTIGDYARPDGQNARSYNVGEMTEDWDGESTDMFAPFNPHVLVCDDFYRTGVKEGMLINDFAQLRVVYHLQKVQMNLNLYRNNASVRIYRKKQDYYRHERNIQLRRLQYYQHELQQIDADELHRQLNVLRTTDEQRRIELANVRNQVEVKIAMLQSQLQRGFSARAIDAATVESDDEDEEEEEQQQNEKKDDPITAAGVDDDHAAASDRGTAATAKPGSSSKLVESSSSTSSSSSGTTSSNDGAAAAGTAIRLYDDAHLPPIPRGVYLYGPVGTGKTLLMNALFTNTSIEKKMRFHMNDFIRDIHHRLHALRNPNNPKAICVARQFAKEYTLIYIDEFQPLILDVAEAVLLRQIFAEMFRLGTVLLATSNRSPTAVLTEGPCDNNDHVRAVAELITKHCIVQEIKSVKDYRAHLFAETLQAYDETKIASTYFCKTATDDYRTDIDYYFRQLLGPDIEKTEERLTLASTSRTLAVMTYRKHDILVVHCQFDDLCDHPHMYLGEVDYRAFAKQIDALVLYDIPTLSDDTEREANRTRRFITLIDTLYEWRRPTICTAVAAPTELFQSRLLRQPQQQRPCTVTTTTTATDHRADGGKNDDVLDRYESTTPQGHSAGATVNVQDLSFAFARTASRLMEMTSASWWQNVYEYFDFAER